ncbi:hypothetical protein Q1695_014737 [Nippostrongylus brasiliensis]|nr:hypothetical protein Q1695_014737 [Nippostrongylus brasiliensis]
MYLGAIPAYPLGYIIVHGFRGDQFWSKFYVDRSVFPPSEQLKELVEQELDKMDDLHFSKVNVTLTDYSEPRVYGGFFLNCGAELQFPVRFSCDDVEQARRLAQNIELDLGLARERRKIEVNSKVGEELVSRMMLSEAAKAFIIQRQLQLANSGVMFCSPMFAWMAIFGAGYAITLGLSSLLGVAAGAIKTKWADEKAVAMGEDYLQGAREDGKKNISKNGDVKLDPIPLSHRLKNVEMFWKAKTAIKEEDSLSRRSLVMRLSRAVLSYKRWNEQASAFLQTKAGRRLRIGLLGGTIIAYPLFSVLSNGPLVNFVFPRRYSVEDLPKRLKDIAVEEYERFLESEARVPKDAVVTHHLGKSLDDYETVASGSLGVRTGLHLAVPCHSRFSNVEEALAYLKEHHPNYINAEGVKVPVQWDTPSGKEIANAFVLSENALRFMFLRDLHAHDGYASLAQRSISWATWTSFTSIFTYWLHNSARIFGGTAVSFGVIYSIFVAAAWFANREWYYLYRYVTDVHADSVAARSSFVHCEGGKELYWKQLKRNRVLRDLCPDLWTKITASGDIRGIATSIVTRYDHLKDLNAEDDELRQVEMVSTALGLSACALSSLFFGSAFVPVKKFDPSNGIFVQWVMSAAILCVGLFTHAFQAFPQFQPLAMLGGAFWALGNVTAIPIMNVLGLGMGMLIWGTTNCVTGWAVGRFGLFGVSATVPALPILNYIGLVMVILGGGFFSQIRPIVHIANSGEDILDGDSVTLVRSGSDEDSPLLSSAPAVVINRSTKRFLAVFVALIAGFFYGITFVPVIYIQDHPEKFPGASRDGLDYVFSHYCGIFLTATFLLVLYIAHSGNNPVVNHQIVGPSLITGSMWAIAQTSWFVANDNLSQSVTFPIISMVPGVCAAMWSVFYFKEITGHRNLRVLTIAIGTTLAGAVLVGISK